MSWCWVEKFGPKIIRHSNLEKKNTELFTQLWVDLT